MRDIHPTALVDRQAELADDVVIGAFSIIKGHVTLGPGTIVHEHSHVHGHTVVGRNCKIGPSAFVGLPPQHLKLNGEHSSLLIGDDVTIREMASVHRSTHPGLENATRIGDRCLLMGGCHVGHDCILGDDVILANSALLGGHVQLDDRVFIGGGCTLHQWIRVGRIAIIAGNEAISHDVPPFAAVRYRGLKGYNAIGCRRSGMSRDSIFSIRSAYRAIHWHRTIAAALADIQDNIRETPEIRELLTFITTTQRGTLHSVRSRHSLTRLYGDGSDDGDTIVAAVEDDGDS